MLSPSTFIPIPELWIKNGRLRLLILANFDLYYEAIDDPWFAASEHFPRGSDNNGHSTGRELFYSRQVLQVIACYTTRYLCSSAKNGSNEAECEDMHYSSLVQDLDEFVLPASQNMSREQTSVLRRVLYAIEGADMAKTLQYQGSTALLASQNSKVGFSLASNDVMNGQWIREVQGLFATVLLNFQTMSAGYVSDPYNLLPSKAPVAEEDIWMCSNQIVNSTTSASFSVAGLVSIFSLGLILLVVAFFSENIAWACRGKRDKPGYFMSEWNALSFLQLQRLAYEGRGLGVWSGEGEVPIELEGQAFDVPRWEGRTTSEDYSTDVELASGKQFSENTSKQLVAIDVHQRKLIESEDLGTEAGGTTSYTSHDYLGIELGSNTACVSDLLDAVCSVSYYRL